MAYPSRQVSALVTERPAEALELVARYLSHDPSFALGWVDAARCALMLGNFDHARAYMMRALHLEPGLVELDGLIAQLA